MYKMPKIVLGVAPTKRGFLSMEEAKRQKDKFMAVIRSIDSDVVEIVDVDDLCENGILTSSFTDPTKTAQLACRFPYNRFPRSRGNAVPSSYPESRRARPGG